VWDLGGQTAQFFKRLMDLAVHLGALRQVQFHRDAGQTAIRSPHHGCDDLRAIA